MDDAARSLVSRLTKLREDCHGPERDLLDQIVLHGVAARPGMMRTSARLPAKRSAPKPVDRGEDAAPEVVGFAEKAGKFALEKEKIVAMKEEATTGFGVPGIKSDFLAAFQRRRLVEVSVARTEQVELATLDWIDW